MKSLIRLGIDESKFSSLDHARCQEIGAAAHFLEFDSLIVPSARWPCLNVVLFMDRLDLPGRRKVGALAQRTRR
jgi:hypothetical protein